MLTLRNILNYRPLRQGLLGNTNQVKPEQSRTHGKSYPILLPSPQTAVDERFLIYYANETKEMVAFHEVAHFALHQKKNTWVKLAIF